MRGICDGKDLASGYHSKMNCIRVWKFLASIVIFFTMSFILFALQTASAQASQRLTVIVNVPAFSPANSNFFFTGGPKTGCDWRTDCLPLKMIDPAGHSLSVELTLPADLKTIEFKITRGQWDNEAADGAGRALANQVINLNGRSTVQLLNVVNWKDLQSLGVTGNLVDLGAIDSPQLGNSREVYVWLPPSYSADNLKRYPVIYMQDGQNLFDPATSAFGVDWDVDGVLTKIASETGLEAIVVGSACANSARLRSHEYDYAFKGAAYASFLIDTLKPKIDKLYRTLPGRESTFVGGSSMGAVISIQLVWSRPEIFSKALAFSLPASVHNHSTFRLVDSLPRPQQPVQFYIDHGGWGEDQDYKQDIVGFIKQLKDKGVSSEQIYYAQFPYHDHTEADWSRRLEAPLKWLLR